MSVLNKVKRNRRSNVTLNHEGTISYSYTAKEELVSLLMNSFLGDNYYTTDNDTLISIKESLQKLSNTDPEFVLKAAAYARRVMNMRSLPQVILAEASRDENLKSFIKKYANLIMARADEPTDVLSYYLDTYGKPLPNVLKRSIRRRIENFSAYQLAKYSKKHSNVSLADAVKLTHPNLGDLGKKIIENSLHADTWEVKLSASKGKNKADVWRDSIRSMGYMALLRNLRNFVISGLDQDSLTHVRKYLTNPENVARSKQLPFRFYSAYIELEPMARSVAYSTPQRKAANDFLNDLELAMDLSIDNVSIGGNNLFLVDSSGSMFAQLSHKSKIKVLDVALILGLIGVYSSDASELWTFDSSFKKRDVRAHKYSLLTTMRNLKSTGMFGGATYLYLPLGELVRTGQHFDNVVVISDMQTYSNSTYKSDESNKLWNRYSDLNPDANLYILNISPYNKGTTIKRDGNVTFVTGWSEKVLSIIGEDQSGIIKKIEQWDPSYENDLTK